MSDSIKITDIEQYLESGHYSTSLPSNAFDGNTTTNWMSNTNTDCYIGIKTTKKYNVNKIRFFHKGSGGGASSGRPKSFYISYSNDGSNWIDLEKFTVDSASTSWQEFGVDEAYSSIFANYWRLRFTEGVYNAYNNLFVPEIELYGFENNDRYLLKRNSEYVSIKEDYYNESNDEYNPTLISTLNIDSFESYGISDLSLIHNNALLKLITDKYNIAMLK